MSACSSRCGVAERKRLRCEAAACWHARFIFRRSDWHRINLKRKVLGLPPVDAAAADDLTAKEKIEDQKSLGGGGGGASGRGK